MTADSTTKKSRAPALKSPRKMKKQARHGVDVHPDLQNIFKACSEQIKGIHKEFEDSLHSQLQQLRTDFQLFQRDYEVAIKEKTEHALEDLVLFSQFKDLSEIDTYKASASLQVEQKKLKRGLHLSDKAPGVVYELQKRIAEDDSDDDEESMSYTSSYSASGSTSSSPASSDVTCDSSDDSGEELIN
eukprot:CAMPEP_0198247126 /NCGR_PEP_ID=MMETSP1446-20131203/46319_1 /TAXON_ID=1461542 ORGANISM="Unidentified sp, Strain CCMP2111" /NCGR_SAMPLE_ID=MMETSP1446 /ASSEMBLY_ACC=CAM_ASM_001112 /LENGTH=186 /DNA_ID=CAMNT_0043931451 /DNA_START=203 /DNA_END=763 /DNA_ORIENTATION=-